ncbi:hypothetical protein U9M48_011324 [Paspalum notatum var. saurae]|uniref:Uncharacterized protein n=1 Tax=Paspalum notatum var. saurae TaxID=547442 RepID=A0AAQ3SVI2_PASNO
MTGAARSRILGAALPRDRHRCVPMIIRSNTFIATLHPHALDSSCSSLFLNKRHSSCSFPLSRTSSKLAWGLTPIETIPAPPVLPNPAKKNEGPELCGWEMVCTFQGRQVQ